MTCLLCMTHVITVMRYDGTLPLHDHWLDIALWGDRNNLEEGISAFSLKGPMPKSKFLPGYQDPPQHLD